ncbi:MAG: hypothetical protein JRI72_10175 [Deltaproteobacteria bacterium]|nr:hypothetical protein [Deltaproteobacteria bacterium]
MVHVIGIDIGSAFSKGIIMRDQKIVGSYVMPSGGNYTLAADRSCFLRRDYPLMIFVI